MTYAAEALAPAPKDTPGIALVRQKYALRSGPDLSRASWTLTAQSVKGDWACYSADAPALSVAEHWREPARKRHG